MVGRSKKVEMNKLGRFVRRDSMKFYTIKLPRFLGGLVRAMIGAFKKNE
jgi:stage V sporulation protein M